MKFVFWRSRHQVTQTLMAALNCIINTSVTKYWCLVFAFSRSPNCLGPMLLLVQGWAVLLDGECQLLWLQQLPHRQVCTLILVLICFVIKQCTETLKFYNTVLLQNRKTVLFCLLYNLPLSKYQSMLWSQQLNSIHGQLLQNLEIYTKSWTNMKLNKNKTWAKFDAWWPTLTRWHKRVEAKQNYNSKSTVTITRTLIAKKTDRICKYVSCDDSCILSMHDLKITDVLSCSFMNKTRSFT